MIKRSCGFDSHPLHNGVIMRTYKYDEWDFEWEQDLDAGGFDDRIYVDLEGNRITGVLEGFYGYSDRDNSQYVENGKRV